MPCDLGATIVRREWQIRDGQERLQSTNMTHPKPDRSNYTPNRSKTPENDQLDIGWNEGFMSDGRPYRIECWAQDQITCVTVFMSTEGLENCNNAQFVELLEREHIVWWKDGARKSAHAMPLTDASGNPIWSVNVVIGVGDGEAVADSMEIRAYWSR